MDIAGVREALHRQPFEPFVIQLADGRALPVRQPLISSRWTGAGSS